MNEQHVREGISKGWVFYGCTNVDALRNPTMGDILATFLKEAEFTVYWRGSVAGTHCFPGEHSGVPGEGGSTGVAIIGESCSDTHAWIQCGPGVTEGTLWLRLFYCQYSGNNDAKAEAFFDKCFDYLEPQRVMQVEDSKYPVEFDQNRSEELGHRQVYP